MFKRVFISYAKEDYKTAEEIYSRLLAGGYQPWLDKKNLKPGQNWDYEINKALRESTFIVLLLSSISVRKRGYIQKEFSLAVDYQKEKLIDDIYIIPILVDDCQIPSHLSKFQWIEMSQERLIEDVLDSLNFQRDKYISTLPVEQIEINEYSRTHIKFDAPPEVRIDYNCDLPLFRENRFFDSSFINTFIQQKVLAQIGQFRSFIYEDLVDLLEQDEGHYFLDIGHSIPLINESNLSIIINYNYYFGGAHPNTEIDTLNFSLKPECLLKFSDIFDLGYNTLHNTIKALLTQFGSDEQKTHLINYINYFNEDNIEYCFRGNALDIIFINQAPRVIMAISILEIPLKNIGSDHIKIRLTNCA